MKLIHLTISNDYYRYDLIRFPSGKVVFRARGGGKPLKWEGREGREAWDAWRHAKWTVRG